MEVEGLCLEKGSIDTEMVAEHCQSKCETTILAQLQEHCTHEDYRMEYVSLVSEEGVVTEEQSIQEGYSLGRVETKEEEKF